eukprot:6491264-Amphidinium_carterae.1
MTLNVEVTGKKSVTWNDWISTLGICPFDALTLDKCFPVNGDQSQQQPSCSLPLYDITLPPRQWVGGFPVHRVPSHTSILPSRVRPSQVHKIATCQHDQPEWLSGPCWTYIWVLLAEASSSLPF